MKIDSALIMEESHSTRTTTTVAGTGQSPKLKGKQINLKKDKSSNKSQTPRKQVEQTTTTTKNNKYSGNKYAADDVHLPVTEIHLKSHEWFGDFITKHEVPRKVFHSSIGFISLYLYTQNVNYKHIAFPLAVAFVPIFILDVIRLNWPFFNKLYCRCVGALMRKREIHTFNGVLWYLLGLIFSFTFFSKDVAIISLFLLSWSDTAASTFGRKWGHLTPKLARNKSLAGSIAAFMVGVVTCWSFYGYFVPHYSYVNKPGEIMWTPETSKIQLHTLAWLGGLVAALSEGIDLFNWDDNFTIPVLSSIFLHLVIYVFEK